MISIVFIIILAIAIGPVMAGIRSDVLRRLIGWLLLAAFITTTHHLLTTSYLLDEDSPILRMFGICCVLLAAMKGLVYAEWARSEKLSMANYLVFSFCWFGMDPGSFVARKRGLAWKGDIVIGAVLTLSGLVGCWLVWKYQWLWLLVVFVPMSITFHFGILRLMKAALRFAGFPVRTLFPNVLKAQGVGDFWSKRWNVGYSQMMQRLVGRPVTRAAGESAGIMAVFVGSGILHELAITLPVQAGYGMPTLYFTLHGLLSLLERKTGRRIGKVPTLLLVALPIGLLFPAEFKEQVIVEILGWMRAFG